MPTLSISPTYASGAVLTEAQLDSIRTPLHTFFNTTKLDSVNVDLQSVVDQMQASEAGEILSTRGVGLSATATLSGSFSFTTTYANVLSVTAPASGTYLIQILGRQNIIRTGTSASVDLDGILYTRVMNSTSTTQIGPESRCRCNVQATAYTQTSRVIGYPLSFSYITSLTANDVVVLQAYREGVGAYDLGSANSTINAAYIDLVRLKI